MNIKYFATAAFAVSAIAMAAPASATINAPVPVTNYITVAGLDWAWAGPCAPFAGNTCNDFFAGDTNTLTAFQAGEGWRVPTAAEWLARPAQADFGGACASPWFGSGWNHCDFGDVVYDYGYGGGSNSAYAETWLVRGGAVPEPATWALMIGGFGLAGAALRRRRTVAA